jgi:4,5-DOPA dioxygenase extradiol
MRRRTFIAALSMGVSGFAAVKQAMATFEKRDGKTPLLFVGHGSPMNAVEDNPFSRTWTEVGASLVRPDAILCVSAHWQTDGVMVTAMDRPRTIHDFYGFPDVLHNKLYPAPGSPDLARRAREAVAKTAVALDQSWGLDHGTWSVLARMFPHADIPVVQLSLDRTQSPAWHYELAKELRALRERGVLIVGSGNIVHNLRRLSRQSADSGFDWAVEFDARIKELIDKGDHQGVIDYHGLGPAARLSVPTNEHFLPLLYVLALKDNTDAVTYFNDRLLMGGVSMRSLLIG